MKIPDYGEEMDVKKLRFLIGLSLCIIVPLGFFSKSYQGPGCVWLNHFGGGLLYEIFWCLAVCFCWPILTGFHISLGVFIVTSLLEVLQLWHPQFLENIRLTFIGKTLIGHSFSFMDFPHYLAGCAIGWIWIRRLKKSVTLHDS